MKRFTYAILVLLITLSFSANAQIEHGNILIGTELSSLNVGLNSPNPVSFNLTPTAAWFIKDNVALGGYLKFGVQSAGSGGSTVFNYGVGLLGRYYAGSDVAVLNHSRFFFEGNAGFGGVDINHGGGNTNGLDIGFGSTAYQNNLTLNFGFQVYLPGQSTAQKVKGDMQ